MFNFVGKLKIATILFLLFPLFVFASITDNFETYNTGDLNGQGSWTAGEQYDVVSTPTQSGSRAVGNITTADPQGADGEKTFTGEANGNQIVYIRSNSGTDNTPYIVMKESGTQMIAVGFRGNGNIEYHDGTSWLQVGTATYVANTWYKIETEWDGTPNHARYRVDDGTWTSFDTTLGGAWATITSTALRKNAGVTSSVYWDDLSDPNAAPPPAAGVTVPQQVIIFD